MSQFIEIFYGMETTPVKDYIDDSFPGEWGTEDKDGNGVKVIRTTNFTNSGKLNLADVVTRSIEDRKVVRKQIKKYDTILERSGGTADNPVGRVVLFEEDNLFLCNNFTQVLRFKDVDPRFAFYALYYFYQTNRTAIRSMGSKTTGIQNLNMSKYLEIGIPNASDEDQKAFVTIAEQADKSKFGDFKSQFIEMFGTVENNTHNFPIMTIGEFANCFAGATPSTSHPEYWENGRIRWMSSGEVHKGHVEDTDSRITELGYKSASTRMVPIHSIVIAIAGQGKTRGTVAITEVDLCTNQSLCAIVPDERVNYSYLYHNLQGRYLELRGLSGDVNGRGGLNLKIIQKIPVILPPIEKQQQFASIAQQADKSKSVIQKALVYLNDIQSDELGKIA
ncbi:restriction endonuclease subunit S [Bacteroides uniformis]|jgi:Restriction endonuclease S subunits|uniref:Restriction endonuclease subunit S n=1 Tax=Bacteroides uniformis TaxID=820 RepID=A0A3E4R9W7_BACUN|nr:restriction endonuclease subunit S [Bacteroides uniformis]RGL17732.1 restriction endonuclease subunit S [Bacteroides uniformis]